jgi:hypothetical protein
MADRREEYRQVGAELLAAAAAAAKTGEDPFQIDPKRVKQRREKKEDPEFAAFEMLLKRSQVYIYCGRFCISQASSYMLIKVASKCHQKAPLGQEQVLQNSLQFVSNLLCLKCRCI